MKQSFFWKTEGFFKSWNLVGQLDRLVHCSSIFLGHLGSKYQYQRDCLVVPQISQNIQKMQQLASFVRFKNKNRFLPITKKAAGGGKVLRAEAGWWIVASRGSIVGGRWRVGGGG